MRIHISVLFNEIDIREHIPHGYKCQVRDVGTLRRHREGQAEPHVYGSVKSEQLRTWATSCHWKLEGNKLSSECTEAIKEMQYILDQLSRSLTHAGRAEVSVIAYVESHTDSLETTIPSELLSCICRMSDSVYIELKAMFP